MSTLPETSHRSEVRDGMRIDWDVADRRWTTASCCAPTSTAPSGTAGIRSSSATAPTPRASPSRRATRAPWERMVEQHPDVAAGSTNPYQSWEVVDPEKWVPGRLRRACAWTRAAAGARPACIDHFSPRETRTSTAASSGPATQPWSNGKVGLDGISYYAMNQWQVAALQPPHLAAMCIWEGAADWYRDATHHGGILSHVLGQLVRHAGQDRAVRAGRRAAPQPPSPASWCAATRRSARRSWPPTARDFGHEILASTRSTTPTTASARGPIGSASRCRCSAAGNWGGQGLHLRGNFEGFVALGRRGRSGSRCTASSTGRTSTPTTAWRSRSASSATSSRARTPAGSEQPPRACCRCATPTASASWSARSTSGRSRARAWTKLHLDPSERGARPQAPARGPARLLRRARRGRDASARRRSRQETEITGPSAAKLFVSSETADADLFLVLRVFDPGRRGGHVPGGASTRTRRSARAGCGPRTASSTRSSASRTGPTTPTTRPSR